MKKNYKNNIKLLYKSINTRDEKIEKIKKKANSQKKEIIIERNLRSKIQMMKKKAASQIKIIREECDPKIIKIQKTKKELSDEV